MIRAIALTGPTASGKTAISIEAARELSSEIISLDSMQIYRGMDIGTAKVTPSEMQGIRHHMIDILSPGELFSAEDYKARAIPTAKEIEARGNLPFFVGGTGLYLDTVARIGSSIVPKSDKSFTSELCAALATEDDRKKLWQRLSSLDPEAAEAIHYNNTKRLVRAYEVCVLTGKRKSELDRLANEKNPDIDILHITLDFNSRENLYSRVDKRVDKMIDAGLLCEARELYSRGYLSGDNTASGAIGYKELLPVLRGEEELGSAIEKIKLASRRYAKRQLTWFRHTDAIRVYLDTEEGEMRNISSVTAEVINIYKNNLQKG